MDLIDYIQDVIGILTSAFTAAWLVYLITLITKDREGGKDAGKRD